MVAQRTGGVPPASKARDTARARLRARDRATGTPKARARNKTQVGPSLAIRLGWHSILTGNVSRVRSLDTWPVIVPHVW